MKKMAEIREVLTEFHTQGNQWKIMQKHDMGFNVAFNRTT